MELKVEDFVAFLHDYHQGYPELRMICPFFGIPLPFIQIQFEGYELNAKIEFSPQLSAIFIQYITKRKNGGMVSSSLSKDVSDSGCSK
jgi:hypothetical protein